MDPATAGGSFWCLFHLQPNPTNVKHSAQALRYNDQVTGYAIARPFGLGHVLGPLVARNDDDAEALFTATARPGVLRVDRLVETENLGRFLF